MSLNTWLELQEMSKKRKGTLGIPDSIHRHGISHQLLAIVKSFYEDEQISQMRAEKKGFCECQKL